MNAADLASSDRLQRVARVLAGGEWHSTREIVHAADVCAVNSAVAELRENGLHIETRCVSKGRWEYRWLRVPVEQLTLLEAA